MIRKRTGSAALVALALIIAAAVGAGLQRVPEGSVGIGARRVHGSGWSWSLPWQRLAVLTREGHLELPDVPLCTREGSTFRYVVEADYRIGTAVAPSLAEDLRRQGLEAATANLATRVLEDAGRRSDAETLVSDPTILEATLRAAFETAGIEMARLRARSEVQDELLLKRRTEQARTLARPQQGRLLVIGIYGADWDTIRPLVAEGRLPNLAKLMRAGAYGSLRSYDPMFSPLLWTTVATGRPPDKHGIADFLVKDSVSGTRRPISSDFRKVKALWNILGDLGRPSGWVAWWASYPAEPIQGVMVTELVAHTLVRGGPDAFAGKKGLTWPEDYLQSRKDRLVPPSAIRYEEMRRLFPLTEAEFRSAVERAPLDAPREDSKEPPDPLIFTVKLLSAMHTYEKLADGMLRDGLPVVCVYFEGVDMMGHRFQHYMAPRMRMVTEAEFERFRNAVPAFYEIQDEMIGELLRAAGPDATTVVLSDHGFLTGEDRPADIPPYTAGQPAEWHRPWGILVMHGPPVHQGELPPSSIYDVTPTLLYLLGLPLAEDMSGRLVSDGIRSQLLASNPPAKIRSYELVGKPLARGAASNLDPEAMTEMMANLRALGYVGGDTGPASPAAETKSNSPADESGAKTQVFYHRNLATFHIKQGNLREAEAELLSANERQPFPKTYAMLAEVRAAGGRYLEAASAIEDGLRKIPEQMEPESILWIVEMHLKANDRAGAEAALRQWGSRATPAVRKAIDGRLKDADGDRTTAMALYEEALGENPLLVQIALRLYALYRNDGIAERIVPVLERGLERSPKADLYHNLLGEIVLSRGDARGAAVHFRKAADLQPENGLYLGNLALAEASAGRGKEAREALSWALRWSPREPEAWMALGSAFDRLGQPNDAVQAFVKARQLGAEGPGADIGIALALARAGRVDEARRVLADASRRFPSSQAVREIARRLGST